MIRTIAALALVLSVTFVNAASAAPAQRAFALSGTNLISFNPSNPAVTTTTAITGVNAGETLVGIDVRPQSGLLYAVGINSTADTGTLYVLGKETGVAVNVGTPSSLSFPSAHATSTTAASILLARATGAPLPVMLVPPMALSRVLLGVHYPSDVATGVAVGAAVAAVATRADRYWPKRGGA